MRSIFRIHYITYIILLSVLLCGFFNYFLIIFFILLWHDLGHIIVIKLYGYKINEILILPIGSIISSDIKSNIKSNRLFLISIMGIVNQLLLYPIMLLMYNSGLINSLSYEIFLLYNKLIIGFNLLPIIPLDGSKIILSIIETFLPEILL